MLNCNNFTSQIYNNEISNPNSSSRDQQLSKSPSTMMICHSRSSLQLLSNKQSLNITTQNTRLSQQLLKKCHSISSPYIKKDAIQIVNISGNQLSSQLLPLSNTNTTTKKYLRSPSHLLTLINKSRFHQQNNIQSLSNNLQNDKEVTLKQLRKQVNKFFEYRRKEMKSKEKKLNYMLPKISKKQQKSVVSHPLEARENKLSKQRKSPHSNSPPKLSPQVLSFRKRYQQQLFKLPFQLTKSLQKKQRFFDLSSQTIKEINNQASAIIKEQSDIVDEDRIGELPEGNKQEKSKIDEKNTTKFSLLHRVNKGANETVDHAVPGFLMQRLAVGGMYLGNSVSKLKRGSFLTELHYQQ